MNKVLYSKDKHAHIESMFNELVEMLVVHLNGNGDGDSQPIFNLMLGMATYLNVDMTIFITWGYRNLLVRVLDVSDLKSTAEFRVFSHNLMAFQSTHLTEYTYWYKANVDSLWTRYVNNVVNDMCGAKKDGDRENSSIRSK